MNEIRNKFDLLKGETWNISTNIIYEHFEISCRESAKEIIPIKEKLKKRTPWENQDICLKRKNLHQAAQLKAISQERIIVWHNHFKDLLGNPTEITVSAISKITNRLNIETAIFTKYELLKEKTLSKMERHAD